MSDEQRGGMEPKAAVRGRPFTEDEPAEDTEGHVIRYHPAKVDEQAGSETWTEPEGSVRSGRYGDDADTEGHGVKVHPAKVDEQAGSETGAEASDDGDTEGHAVKLRPFTEPTDDDTEGHAGRFRPFTEPTDEDTEGHAGRFRGSPMQPTRTQRATRLGASSAPSASPTPRVPGSWRIRRAFWVERRPYTPGP